VALWSPATCTFALLNRAEGHAAAVSMAVGLLFALPALRGESSMHPVPEAVSAGHETDPRPPELAGDITGITGPARTSRAGNLAQWALGIAAIAAVIVAATRGGEAREFARLLRGMRPAWIFAAVALQAATYACDASIWLQVLSCAGSPQPFRRMFRLSIAKVFTSQALPSGGVSGDVVVVRALAKYGVPLDASMTALVIGLFGFYAAFAVCALSAAIVFYASGAGSGAVRAIVLPFSLVMVALPALLAWLVRSSHAARRSRWSRIPGLARVLDALGRARMDLVRRRSLLARSTMWQIATFLFDAATLLVMLAAFGNTAPAADVFAAFMLASAAELVGPVPGGLGAFEGGCIIGLHAFGVPIATALLATLMLRGFTFWLPMIPGFFIARWAVAPSRGRS
jgi:uncharacterized protein (TIRG00374 family)